MLLTALENALKKLKQDISITEIEKTDNKAKGKFSYNYYFMLNNVSSNDIFIMSVLKDLGLRLEQHKTLTIDGKKKLPTASEVKVRENKCFKSQLSPNQETFIPVNSANFTANPFLARYIPENFFKELFEGNIALSTFPEAVHADSTADSSELSPAANSLLSDHNETGEAQSLYHIKKTTPQQNAKITNGRIIYINGLPTIISTSEDQSQSDERSKKICNEFLPNNLTSYIARLSIGEDAQVVMQDLLCKVNDEVQKNLSIDSPSSIDFSCTISYECNGQTYVTSISSGKEKLELLSESQNTNTVLTSPSTQAEIFLEPREVKARDTLSLSQDNINIYATIPTPEKRKALNDHALDHYKWQIIAVLKQKYPWRPRVFGHHHGERMAGVCDAILDAKSSQQVQLILQNQCDIIKHNLAASTQSWFTPINGCILHSNWTIKIKNKPTQTSGYKLAIDEAMKHIPPPSLAGG